MSPAIALALTVIAVMAVLLALTWRALVKAENESCELYHELLRVSGERASAQAKVRRLEADRISGRWTRP